MSRQCFFVVLTVLIFFSPRITLAEKRKLPDLIVSDVRVEGNDLLVEIQNQGPGTAAKETEFSLRVQSVVYSPKRAKKSVTTKATVPTDVFAIEEVCIPLVDLGIATPNGFSGLFTVSLDLEKEVAEAREENNRSRRQIQVSDGFRVVQPLRGDYHEKPGLPDLVITDITTNKAYVHVHYMNRGKGTTGGDFTFQFRCGKRTFASNPIYRYVIPPPGKACQSGGLTLGVLGLRSGDEATIEVIVDHEDRVRESDEKNNTMKKGVKIE